jgi:hypothetical protein
MQPGTSPSAWATVHLIGAARGKFEWRLHARKTRTVRIASVDQRTRNGHSHSYDAEHDSHMPEDSLS